MALSKSIIRAQDIISCNLCELETKLEWRCVECDLIMCNKCRNKIHPKFKNAKYHTIVDIKQARVSGDKGNLDLEDIRCKVHTTQVCCLFCSYCDSLVCPICITKTHAGHTFIEIKEALETKLEKLKSIKTEVETATKELSNDVRKLDQMKLSEQSKGKKVLQDIHCQKEAFNTYADQLSDIVQQKIKASEGAISREQKRAVDMRQRMQEECHTVDDLICCKDPLNVFENIDKVVISLKTTMQHINPPNSYIPQFMPGNITQSTFGSLTEVFSSNTTNKIEMKVNKQFFTELTRCHYLSVCSDDTFWLGDSISKVLHKIKHNGDSLVTITTIKTKIRGIVVTTDGDILLADATSRLKLINGTSGKVQDSKYSVFPLSIMSVHLTRDNKVIVGAKSPGKIIPVTGRRVVIVMDKDGIHETVYEHTKNKKGLLTYPQSITSTANGSVVVADFTHDFANSSRILALDKDGNILNTYKGHPEINTLNKPFQPEDITSTPLDNIIIPDLDFHIIHILDNSCNLIAYYNMRDIGIAYPYCTAFTSTTSFYLGCAPPTDNSTNAKLYEIEYSGF
ncbi:E3 ubiquitin-protein ligase TRIM71-like [Mytilus edulis]|uniref:E3 ubiquitin-protein ligase TRIM71-like n=1 Tax=Mytilus edulis TaxID=6550 RepID=UPI0039EF8EDF